VISVISRNFIGDPRTLGTEWCCSAIRQWRESVATAFEYTVAIIGSEAFGDVDGGQRHEVYTHLEGNFPGDQVDLTNRFTLRGDLIVGLEIVPTAVTS
jgi:hypothetical protein